MVIQFPIALHALARIVLAERSRLPPPYKPWAAWQRSYSRLGVVRNGSNSILGEAFSIPQLMDEPHAGAACALGIALILLIKRLYPTGPQSRPLTNQPPATVSLKPARDLLIATQHENPTGGTTTLSSC
jgi:hypothetical protein